jgi:uncharacterized protein (TIGR00730 family)
LGMKRVCVFLGAASGVREDYVRATVDFASALAARDLELVYGGGGRGLMGTLADAMLAAGGRVIGVIPRGLVDKEMAHAGLTELHVVDSMLERKRVMLEMSDVFVALPGGFGTLDEFFEALTWSQIGTFSKPSGLLNVDGFFDPLLAWIDRAVQDGLIREAARAFLLESQDTETLLDALLKWRSPGEVGLK